MTRFTGAPPSLRCHFSLHCHHCLQIHTNIRCSIPCMYTYTLCTIIVYTENRQKKKGRVLKSTLPIALKWIDCSRYPGYLFFYSSVLLFFCSNCFYFGVNFHDGREGFSNGLCRTELFNHEVCFCLAKYLNQRCLVINAA